MPDDWLSDRYDDGKELVDSGRQWAGDRISDGSDAAGDAADSATDAVIPDWASALSNAEVLGYELLENPGGFVIAAVMDWFVAGILSFAGAIAVMLYRTWLIFTGVIIDAGAALLDPFRAVGDVFVSTTEDGDPTGILNIINAQIIDVAAAAGPAGPLVVVVLWAILVFALALLVRTVYEVAKWA